MVKIQSKDESCRESLRKNKVIPNKSLNILEDEKIDEDMVLKEACENLD